MKQQTLVRSPVILPGRWGVTMSLAGRASMMGSMLVVFMTTLLGMAPFIVIENDFGAGKKHLNSSVAVSAEIPLRSPQKIFLFIIKKIIFWFKVSKNKIK